MRKCLDATTAAMLKEREEHAATRKQLEDANEKIRILNGKLEHMFELYAKHQARLESEIYSMVGMVGMANAEAHDRGVQLALVRQRYERVKLTLERAEMQEMGMHDRKTTSTPEEVRGQRGDTGCGHIRRRRGRRHRRM